MDITDSAFRCAALCGDIHIHLNPLAQGIGSTVVDVIERVGNSFHFVLSLDVICAVEKPRKKNMYSDCCFIYAHDFSSDIVK